MMTLPCARMFPILATMILIADVCHELMHVFHSVLKKSQSTRVFLSCTRLKYSSSNLPAYFRGEFGVKPSDDFHIGKKRFCLCRISNSILLLACLTFYIVFAWCPCMAINVSVHNGWLVSPTLYC